MNKIIAIARNTFKEAIRNRILYVILMFALILIVFSNVVGELTIASRDRIIKDLGFMAINLFGLAIAVFVGVTLVYNELEKKTIYTIVSKPIGRWQFLLGKYFGLLMTVYVNILIMTWFFLVSLHYYAGTQDVETFSFFKVLGTSIGRACVTLFHWNAYPITAHIMPVIGITLLEMAMITAFSVLYSSFSTPTLSMFFTVLTFIAGRLSKDIVAFAEHMLRNTTQAAMKLAMEQAGPNAPAIAETSLHVQPPLSYYLALGAAHLVPNFYSFHDSVGQAIYEQKLELWWGTVLYGVLYTIGILSLSIVIFHRRNFK